jgi:predicted GTPase
MPYRDLRTQRAERFGSVKDLSPCTIEEREEFEPLVEQGVVVYAGVDYQEILGRAQREADILLWDGGNNDLPFLVPDVHVVLVDPHRPGNELSHYPGQANVRMADIIVVSKVNTALPEAVKAVIRNVKTVNPQADVVKAGLAITVHTTLPLAGKRVLVVEDGPTLTHGNMPFGAGLLAARQRNARALDPRRYAVGSIRGVYQAYPALGPVLPAIGYSLRQIRELERTINRVPCDYVLDATPANLQRILRVNKPVINITYELEDYGNALWKAVERRLRAEKKQ